jgi:3-dehydroquinate synthase
VALGIICELWHSVKKLNFPSNLFNEIKEYIFQNFRTYPIKEQDIETLIDLMKKDKKNQDQQIAIVLLKGIGEPKFDSFIDEQEIRECLNFFINQ